MVYFCAIIHVVIENFDSLNWAMGRNKLIPLSLILMERNFSERKHKNIAILFPHPSHWIILEKYRERYDRALGVNLQ